MRAVIHCAAAAVSADSVHSGPPEARAAHRTRDHLVDEKPQPAVRLLGEYEHPKVVALGLAAAVAHVAYPLQDVVVALEIDLAAL